MSRRIFIAIDIDKNIRDSIYSYCSKTFTGNQGIRVIPSENLHVTLKFIGKTEEARIEYIKRAVTGAVSGIGQFDFGLEENIGAFPGLSRARIVFLGTGRGSNRIKEIFDLLEKELEKIGVDREERDFHPHITIARIKKPLDLTEIAGTSGFSWKEQVKVGSVTLYESILGRQGAKYINIGNFGLK